MTDQVETKQVTWEDLEVAAEPKTISLNEYEQALLKQSLNERQRLIQGEPGLPEIIEWEEGNEPVPAYEPAIQGVLILQGAVDMKAFEEAVMARVIEDSSRRQLVQVTNAFRLPPSELQLQNNMLPEDMERMRESMGRIRESTGHTPNLHLMNAFCTPSRDRITGHWTDAPVQNFD